MKIVPIISISSFDYLIKMVREKRKPNKKILLLHAESVTVLTPQSKAYTVPILDLEHLVFEADKPLLLLAAPFVFSYVQQTIHLKKSELIQADSQTLEFSRFPKENRILESIDIDGQQSITSYNHLSNLGTETLTQLKRKKLKYSWKPAVSFMIYQFIRYPNITLQTTQNLNLIMEQEILQVGWKEKKVSCHHLFYWPQHEENSQPNTSAELLLEPKDQPQSTLPIHFADSVAKDSNINLVLRSLFFPSGKPRRVKLLKKQLKKNRFFKLKKISVKYLLISITVIMLAWTASLKIKLFELKANREALMETISSLQYSTAELNQIATMERASIKISALIKTLQITSFDPLAVIEQLHSLIPKSAWIQTLKVDRNSIQLEILDSSNSSITDTISLLTGNFGDVRLDSNSIIQIDSFSLRKRSFTINRGPSNDTR